MNPLNDFMKNARGLTKNPLGIIGLFISLIYGFECLVLSKSISNLNSPVERIPLIWFIIIFPIVILGAFLYLVVNHHEKLYAPSDFRDDNAFIETMSGKKIKEKQEKEAELLSSAEEEEDLTTNKIPEPKIKEEPVNQEKTEATKETPKLDKQEIAIRFANSEKWAIKELELKYNIPFRTNQRIVTNNMKLELDAYGQNSSKVIIAEVKYWHSHRSVKPLLLSIQEFVLKIDRFKRGFSNKKVELAIVIVFDEIRKTNVDRITEFISELGKDVSVEFKQYSQLESDYKE